MTNQKTEFLHADRIRWNDFPEAKRESFCEAFLKMGAAMFERPEVQKEFEEWQKRRSADRIADTPKNRKKAPAGGGSV